MHWPRHSKSKVMRSNLRQYQLSHLMLNSSIQHKQFLPTSSSWDRTLFLATSYCHCQLTWNREPSLQRTSSMFSLSGNSSSTWHLYSLRALRIISRNSYPNIRRHRSSRMAEVHWISSSNDQTSSLTSHLSLSLPQQTKRFNSYQMRQQKESSWRNRYQRWDSQEQLLWLTTSHFSSSQNIDVKAPSL